ncbi:DUF4282 domain-containing protein [Brucella pituitosa]|uniref:DUF4282 domain-containing protein n=1 Tax=Brucella pituitosa TaxID=571256 RepID=A0A643F647_9HYPH|nr:DUF4282 domain-containing protein [Brucella pituitosa]KAB0573716.1 DUF4282 domain-containing protein [Brucella pituitosa]
MKLKDCLLFDKFITTSLVTIIYWLGLLVNVSLSVIFAAGFLSNEGMVIRILGGLFVLVFSAIIWRVICEGIILVFRIYDRLTEIRGHLATKK